MKARKLVPLSKNVNLSTTRSFPCCDGNTTATTLVLDVLEAIHDVWNDEQWHKEAAEAQCPETRKKELALRHGGKVEEAAYCVQSPLSACVFVKPR
jgi:hypothetical protein